MIVSKCPCVAPHHQSEQVDTIFLFNAHGCHIHTEDEFHEVRHLVDNSPFAANLDKFRPIMTPLLHVGGRHGYQSSN